MKYPNRLRETREARGKKQKTIASVIGVNPSTYSLMEKGERGISTDKLIKLASWYGCTTDELLGSWAWYAASGATRDDNHEDEGQGHTASTREGARQKAQSEAGRLQDSERGETREGMPSDDEERYAR